MRSKMNSFRCNFIITIFFLHYVSSGEINITIQLDKNFTQINRELFGDFVDLNSSSSLRVNFERVNEHLGFIIFQAHSHLHEVSAYKNDKNSLTYNGTNAGFYSSNPLLDTFYVKNNNNVDLKLYISVHGYRYTEPIPGGCSLTAKDALPYIQTTYTKDYIFVDLAPPQVYKDTDCVLLLTTVSVNFYMMYLPENNYDPDIYFEAIRNMMTWDKIRKNGKLVPVTYWSMRRMLSAYPGTGVIFVAVARAFRKTVDYAVYVPTYTYACAPLQEDGCELLYEPFSQLLCALLLFLGLFICYVGHRFFKTQTFIVGVFGGATITYIVMCLITDLDRPALLSVSALTGVCLGAFRLMCWWLFGIPLVSIIVSTLNVGFLSSSLLFFTISGFESYLGFDVNFWGLFMMVMCLMTMVLLMLNHISNMICCAVLGSYATVFSIDYYLGSNLKYIIINTVRRAVVDKFNFALIFPPFQWRDSLLAVLWVILASTGFVFQYYHNKGKPPFPPPPRSVRAVPEFPIGSPIYDNRYIGYATAPGERTPLLA